MIFTLGNKVYINNVFEKSFKNARIHYERFSCQPTILNNFLWYAVAETSENYHLTFYSLFDKTSTANKIITVDKNHQLLDMNTTNLKVLTWFSNRYFRIIKKENSDNYQYTDLRYPMLNPEDPNTSIFNFTIYKKEEEWDIYPFDGSPPKSADFKKFLERIKGI